MTHVIVMGSCSKDIIVDADLPTTIGKVKAFLVGRGNYDVRQTINGKVVVTPGPREFVDRKKLAEEMLRDLCPEFTDQLA